MSSSGTNTAMDSDGSSPEFHSDPTISASTGSSSYNATQAASPSFWQNIQPYLDPTLHPLLWGIGAIALVALVGFSTKEKPRSKKSTSSRTITIKD